MHCSAEAENTTNNDSARMNNVLKTLLNNTYSGYAIDYYTSINKSHVG